MFITEQKEVNYLSYSCGCRVRNIPIKDLEVDATIEMKELYCTRCNKMMARSFV